jgi:hypothetical protein
MTRMATMFTVPVVHKHVHERTREEGKPNEETEHVSAVLCKEQHADYCEKTEHH